MARFSSWIALLAAGALLSTAASAEPVSGTLGPYAVAMEQDASLPDHTIYRPADLNAVRGKLPMIAFGNGGCANVGSAYKTFLGEVASHGYVVTAPGPIEPPAPVAGQRPSQSKPQQMQAALTWAQAQAAKPGGVYQGRIDTDRLAVMGQSCGGVQTFAVAGDPRITTLMIWNSGVGMIPNNPADPAKALASIHTPVAFIYGDAQNDIAHRASAMNVPALTTVPVFGAWQDGMTHLGTYGQKDGGFYGKIAVAWLDWRLKGDQRAARMFKGADCTLCTAPSWHVTKSKID